MGESLAERFLLEGFEVDWWRTGAEAAAALARRRYAVVISDIRLPDCSGGDLFVELGTRLPMLPPFLFMTAFGTIDRAVELLKAGAADYITKPFDPDALVAKDRALAHDYGAGAGVELDADALGVSLRVSQGLEGGDQGRFHPIARGLFTPATDLGEGVHAGLAERVHGSVHVDCVDADDNRAEHVVRLDAQEDVHALCYLSVMVAILRSRVMWSGAPVVGPGLTTHYWTSDSVGVYAALKAAFTATRGAIPIGVTWWWRRIF